MRNSLYLSIATLVIALLCMGTQCDKEGIEYKYTFMERINLFPSQKRYRVRDTIWLQYASQNNRLYDNRTSNHVAADTVSVGFQVSFNSRYNATVNPPDGFCDFITSTGVNVGRYLSYYGTGFFFTFGCNSSNNYDFTIGVIPKQKGIYSLDLSGTPWNVTACSNRISPFPFSTIEYRFNVADCNKDVYLSIPPLSRGETPKGSTEGKINSKQVYVVRVE